MSLALLAVAGGVLGYFVFFEVSPGKPQIGVIDIPFTIITDDSAFVITAFLDYARQTDSIKAVVIKLNSPGGGAASSEKLFIETRKLREEKPVVVVMNEIVASGGYMMSLGANYTYAKTTSLVGSVGVILGAPGPLIPSPPGEDLVTSGPFKLSGGPRRYWIGLVDELKQAFVQMVLTERGDKLRLAPEEIAQARIYSGVEGVKLGLVDAIGDDTDAIEKAASLAGISNYDLVDVNTEVFRLFVQKLVRILEPLLSAGDQSASADIRTLAYLHRRAEDSSDSADGSEALEAVTGMEMLRRLFLPSGADEGQERALPGFPLKVNPPNMYYLYVGPSQ